MPDRPSFPSSCASRRSCQAFRLAPMTYRWPRPPGKVEMVKDIEERFALQGASPYIWYSTRNLIFWKFNICKDPFTKPPSPKQLPMQGDDEDGQNYFKKMRPFRLLIRFLYGTSCNLIGPRLGVTWPRNFEGKRLIGIFLLVLLTKEIGKPRYIYLITYDGGKEPIYLRKVGPD